MNWTISQTVDLSRGYTPVVWPDALMVSGDDKAHTWRVAVLDGGTPADLSGAAVTGFFVREDGVTVAVAGSVSGNTVSVTLAQNCYAVAGRLGGVLRMEVSGKTVTLSSVIFTVKRLTTDSMVDPGQAFPSLSALSTLFDALEAQVQALASGSPAGTYADLAALISADPDHSKIYITLDDGKWCYWDSTAFVAGGTYQATNIADNSVTSPKLSDGSVTPAKTTFLVTSTDNLFNKYTITSGYYVVKSTGAIEVNADYYVSDWIPVTESTDYVMTPDAVNGRFAWYTSAKVYISGGDISGSATSPASAGYLRVSYKPAIAGTSKDLVQVCAGTVLPGYSPYGSTTQPYELIDLKRIDTLERGEFITVSKRLRTGDPSNEVAIIVPSHKPNHVIVYRLFRQTNATPTENYDVWRTVDARIHTVVGGVVSANVLYPLTTQGEWDMAVKPIGRADFIGGANHGDEVMTSATWLVDGVETDMEGATAFEVKAHEVRLVCIATMYDPDDHATVVGTHRKEWIFTIDGMKLNQRIDWVASFEMESSYLNMFPVYRKYPITIGTQITDRTYNDVDYIVYDVSTDGNGSISRRIHGVSKQALYGRALGVMAEITVQNTPHLTGSNVYVSDTAEYNKVYSDFCGSGHSVTSGDFWETRATYNVTYRGV